MQLGKHSNKSLPVRGRSPEQGVVMLEAAIALPVFLILITLIFALGNLMTKYSSMMTALNAAAHGLQAISSVQGVTEEQALQYSGNLFLEKIQAFSLSEAEVIYDPSYVGSPYILVGKTAALTPRGGDTPPAIYELRARLWPQNLLANMFPAVGGFFLSTIVVIETGNSMKRPTGGNPGQVVVYQPSLAAGSRVHWIAEALLPTY